jgi:hypothetical protein
MAWYKTGTVTVTNGSATVTGAGTAFVGSVLAGQGFAAPDGKIYEIDTVVSATQITLASPYLGATAAGAAYTILPTIGGLSSFASRLDTLLTAMQGVVDGAGQGKFGAGTPAAPGLRFTADGDTGFTNPTANQIGMVTGGVLRALLSGTAFNLSVPLTGTAVTQSATDATAGRLTKVGDFGLGSFGNNPGASDYSTLGGVSQIISDSITPTPADKPTLGRAFAGLHLAAAANRWVQFLAEVAGGSDPAKLWFRRNYSGAVSAWQQIFSQGNILGTVA